MRINKFSFFLLLCSVYLQAQISYTHKTSLLASPFEIIVTAKDTTQAKIYVSNAVNEVKRIENLISDWLPNSQISQVNAAAGKKSIVVDNEVFELVQRAINLSKLTSGAFDISYASMDKIWKFDGSMREKPSEEAILNSVKRVGYKKITLDPKTSSLFLKEEGMKLGLGGIGQGYIADKIKDLLINQGCSSGLVNVSGDITTWGETLENKPWQVAIINPFNKEKVFAWFPLVNSAVETSGSYEKYVTFDEIRYSHIIDPRTGWPSKGIISVSVFAPKTELADALSTAIFVLGIETGLNLINQLKDIECLIIDDKGGFHVSEKLVLDTQINNK